MAGDPPRVYILYGDDEFSIGLSVAEIESKVGDASSDDASSEDASLAQLNTSHIDGRSSKLEDLRLVLGAVPFFVTRRLVIVNDLLTKLPTTEQRDNLLAILDSVPVSTALVLVEQQMLKDDHWLLVWARNASSKTYVRAHRRLKIGEMVRWIENQTEQMGGNISRQAAILLAGLVEDDTRVAYHEIQKLLAYTGYRGSIVPEDVELQVLSLSQANIFELVDAIGGGNNRKAIAVLRKLCEINDHYQIFIMIIRQIRLVMLAKEILSEGKKVGDVARMLQQHSYVAGKIVRQAKNFSGENLEDLYRRLLFIDSAVKTGEQEWDIAMESLVVSIS